MTDTPTEADSDVEVSKKPAKEVPVVQDHGFFKHTTGDLYDGYFEAKKKDRSVRMHGNETKIPTCVPTSFKTASELV